MRDSYDLMLNIIDLPSLAHRRQLPPRTARQEKLFPHHCEVTLRCTRPASRPRSTILDAGAALLYPEKAVSLRIIKS